MGSGVAWGKRGGSRGLREIPEVWSGVRAFGGFCVESWVRSELARVNNRDASLGVRKICEGNRRDRVDSAEGQKNRRSLRPYEYG